VVLNEEAREFKWLPLAAAQKLPLNKPTKILLEAVCRASRRRAPARGSVTRSKAGKRSQRRVAKSAIVNRKS
jgi:hypothetical protein